MAETDEVNFHLLLPGGKVKRQCLLVVLGAGKGTHAGLDSEPRVARPDSPRQLAQTLNMCKTIES